MDGPELIFGAVAVVTVTVAMETVPPLVKVVSIVYVIKEDVDGSAYCVVGEETVVVPMFVAAWPVAAAVDWTPTLVPFIPIQLLRLLLIS